MPSIVQDEQVRLPVVVLDPLVDPLREGESRSRCCCSPGEYALVDIESVCPGKDVSDLFDLVDDP